MGLHQAEKLVHNKNSVQEEERQPTDCDRTFTNYVIDKGLVSRIYGELKKLNNNKANDSVKKWAKDINKYFPKDVLEMASRYMRRCSGKRK